MDQRLVRAAAAVAVLTMPLLAGCGTGSARSDGSAGVPGTLSPAAPTGGAAVVSTPSPTPGADQALQTRRVQAATRKFVLTVLTIGYPDQTFADYTGRIEPLMTPAGFDSLESADSIKRGSTALTSLYAQRARSAPKFAADPEVTSLEATSASAELAYENVAEQKSGRGWRTLKSLGKGTVTVRLVLDDGTWLVDKAS